MMGSIIAGILIFIVLLALLGLGWDTFVSGVGKGADKSGIAAVVQGALVTYVTNKANESPSLSRVTFFG